MLFTPLRYPGGKSKLYDLFSLLVDSNFKTKPSYAEPYAGGAGLALALLLTDKVKNVYINDYDRSIYAFWYTLLNSTDRLIDRIEGVEVTVQEWERQHLIQKDKEYADLFELGFSTFFLNRTNRSGIIKGGMIGGKRQESKWKLDARFNKADLICRIKRIAERKNDIHVSNLDAMNFLDKMRAEKLRNIFYYLDPPYIKKAQGLYAHFYNENDHRNIASAIRSFKSKWVVSYDSEDFVKELYDGYSQMTYDLRYSAQTKRCGREFMAFSHTVSLSAELQQMINVSQIRNISNVNFKVA